MQWADQTASTVPLLIAERSVASAIMSGSAAGFASTRSVRQSAKYCGTDPPPSGPHPTSTSTLFLLDRARSLNCREIQLRVRFGLDAGDFAAVLTVLAASALPSGMSWNSVEFSS